MSAPISAHAAIPFANCCRAALPGNEVMEGLRLTLANNINDSLSLRVLPKVAGTAFRGSSARMKR